MRPDYRPLDWPADAERLVKLDLSCATRTVYDVRAGSDGFTLTERSASPPQRKTYTVGWAGLRAATTAVVAEDAGRLLGVVAMTIHGWNRRAVITDLYVDRGARGRGVGGGFLGVLRRAARTLGARCLWVETQHVNAPAVRFYRRHGFACCGLDLTLYDPRVAPGEVALLFAAALDAPVLGPAVVDESDTAPPLPA